MPRARPSLRDLALFGGVVLLAAVAVRAFLPLYAPIEKISGRRFSFYTGTILPAGLKHAGAAVALWLFDRRRGRAVVLFWIVTGAVLVAAGGVAAVAAFAALSGLSIALICSGRWLARPVLRPADRRWPVGLGLGILAASFGGAVLGSLGIFVAPLLGLLLLAATVAVLRRDPRARFERCRRLLGRALRGRLNLAQTMASESCWLVGAFAWVAGSAPEQRSDALRAYLPFTKILAHFHHLPATPVPWTFVVPEAGSAYSAILLSLAGVRAARYAMPLCLLALAGIVATAGKGRYGKALGRGLAAAVASTPIVLGTSLTLMNEAFVSLGVVVVAWIAVRTRKPFGPAFGLLLGSAAGTCVAAKYTTLPYLAAIGLFAAIRVARSGWRVFIRVSACAAAAAFVAFLPWMWHAWRLVGNPLFPFLTGVFPTRVYPRGLGMMNLARFEFARGWLSWLRAPLDFTYASHLFSEGFNGSLGLTLLLLFVSGGLLLFVRTGASAPVLVASALLAAAALWTQTAYIRYWLPTLWLLALAGTWGYSRLLRNRGATAAGVVAVLAGLVFLHVPVMTAQQWAEPDGFPWSYYRGETRDADFLRRLRGYPAMEEFARRAPAWPTVLETEIDSCSHIDASCLELGFWHVEFLMDIKSPDRAIDLVDRTGAEYWAVDSSSDSARYFRDFGVAARLWRPDNLVFSSGPFRVYRLRPPAERSPGRAAASGVQPAAGIESPRG